MKSTFAALRSWWQQVESVLAAVILGSAVLYAVITRPVEQVLKYGPAAYAVFVVVFNAMGIWVVLRNPSATHANRRRIFRAMLLTSAVALPFSAIYLSCVALAIDLFEFSRGQQQLEQRHLMAAAAVVTAALGVGFFWFRLRQRFLYGFSEALAGVAVATHRVTLEKTMGIPADTAFYFAILTAGIYLVVRGFDNMHQAIQKGDQVYGKMVEFMSATARPSPPRRLPNLVERQRRGSRPFTRLRGANFKQ